MNPYLDAAPSVIQELAAYLSEVGFQMTAERDTTFGGWVIEWDEKSCMVRIEKERYGWVLGLSTPGLGAWYSPEVWCSILDNRPVQLDEGLDWEADFVRGRWRDIGILDVSPQIRVTLESRADAMVRESLGWPPLVEGEID